MNDDLVPRKELFISTNQVRDVIFDAYGILTPEDQETCLQTVGISTCTALVLHFPESRTLALAHILPTGSLESFLYRIKRDLEGKVNEAPAFFIEDGPQGYLKYGNPHLEQRTVQDILQYFPNAIETKKVLRDVISKDEQYINLAADKNTGVIHVYSGGYSLPKITDFWI